MHRRHAFIVAVACALGVAVVDMRGQSASGTYKGLEMSLAGVSRATNVSLTDCPPGANSVRGVIRPGDQFEFASVTLDFKVQASFKPGAIPSPVLHDATGKTYNTAQAFGEIAGGSPFSCTFSFRVPKEAKLSRLAVDTVSIDLTKTAQD